MKRAPLLGLVTLGALALGLGMWRATSDRRVAVLPVPTVPPELAAEEASLAPAFAPAPEIPAESRQPATALPAEAESREVEVEHAPVMRWLEGTMIFPPGTPADEKVTVSARFSDSQGVAVERDGRFRIPVPETLRGTMTGGRYEQPRWRNMLSLTARYLWLEEEVPWDRETLEPVTLRPILGGRIEGLVSATAGLDGPGTGVVKLLGGDSGRPFAKLGRDSTFAFDAVDAAQTYTLSYEERTLVGRVTGVRVQPGRTSVVDLVLEPGIVLAGRARDEAGRPVPRLDVTALTDMHESWTSQKADETSRDGAFRIEGVAPGAIRLEAKLKGHLSASLELGELAAGERREDLELVLENAGVIAGRVLWPDGAPAQAWVSLEREAASPLGENEKRESVQTDGAGRFLLTGLRDGPFLVKAASSRSVGGRTTRLRAEVPHVQPDEGEITLTLAESHGVRGRVVVGGDALTSRFTVRAWRPDRPAPTETVWGEVRGTFESEHGSFLLTGLVPGEWQLRVEGPEGFCSEGVRVVVPSSEGVELSMQRPAKVSGLIFDEHGAPAAGVFAYAAAGRGGLEYELSEVTAEDGAFTVRDLLPGRVTLTAYRGEAAAGPPLELELSPGEERADIVLRLSGAGR